MATPPPNTSAVQCTLLFSTPSIPYSHLSEDEAHTGVRNVAPSTGLLHHVLEGRLLPSLGEDHQHHRSALLRSLLGPTLEPGRGHLRPP